ncbi:MAG: glucoamylase family protein, partial [Ferruginibacter sp.]
TEQLLKRLAENEKILLEVHAILTETIKNNNRVVPAAEWLLDNFYLIEEQIYTGKKHLPKGYSVGLPRLLKGPSAGLPRIYDIAVEIISHSDGHVNINNLTRFVSGYQNVNYLLIGELWALPIMLRLALLENLRRLSIQISIDISSKSEAAYWADLMIDAAENNPKNLVLVIADMARAEPPMESSFVAELTRRLQEKGSALALALNWIEQRLSDDGYNISVLIQQENQKQAVDQVSISNSISSLRFLSTTDWQGFVEDTSIVEKILEDDPMGIYEKMDFDTRDQYRHAVERIAKKSVASEKDVAALVVQSAKKSLVDNAYNNSAHVGYYLIGKGVKEIEQTVKMRTSFIELCCKLINRAPFFVYSGSIFILTVMFSCWPVWQAFKYGLGPWWLTGFAFLLAIPISQFAITFVNWVITILAKPALLPQMDFSKGVPVEYRTMVVIPTLVTSSANITDLVEGLEVRFLANRDANISFALLTDFRDSNEEKEPGEDLLLKFAINKIETLNKKYDRKGNDTFFLFHRQRQWNTKEKKWMGYERKRGKLGALNALILEGRKDAFSAVVADEAIYRSIKYIITLDTDTQLPRDTASKMVGKMTHPLNQPVYSEKKRRLINGYTILQPRVSNSLPISGSPIYARIHGNEPGTDPYTRAVSDVYQDLFKEGSFIGKGIYDVAVFEKILDKRFPENRILSHDLLEGAYARAGLMTDVQLYEEYPDSYLADIQRRHRWIRGDWQIADWVTPFVPGYDRKLHKNPVSTISKWKIFDNLRRSLVPIATLLLLLAGWTILHNVLLWNIVFIAIIFLPAFVNYIWELYHKPKDVVFHQHFAFVTRSLKDHLAQSLIDLICLPFESFNNLHAILITAWRTAVSGKNLLQWNPSSHTRLINTLGNNLRKMWIGPFIAITCFIYLSFNYPLSLVTAFPFLIAWLLSPFVAWYVSRPAEDEKDTISVDQTIYLRQLARKIWSFFETYVTKEDNWLPPDNYQQEPVERIAHRTSPTNIGLSLLSNLTADDFGYITHSELLERTANTMETLHRMERYRGHFYNWYDTQTLATLNPKYISTVDSGNFVGHVMTLKQALLVIPEKKIIGIHLFEGMIDTLGILIDKTKEKSLLIKFKEDLENNYAAKQDDVFELKNYLENIEASLKEILTQLDLDPDEEDDWWAEKLVLQIKNIKKEIVTFFPWVQLPKPPAKFETLLPDLPAVPNIAQLSKIEQTFLQKIIAAYYPDNSTEENEWLNHFREGITESARRAKEMLLRLGQLIARCNDFANIEFDFLYDKTQHLLSIGYNVDEHRRDNSFYDLLASEARLTTFVGIAQGKLPQQSWFALGRQLTSVGSTSLLLSWSGSMFEYLMPMLVMPSYENTLLDQTHKAVVQKQMEYGRKRNVPWGISESGYSMVDAHLNYQYRAFGVPGLGFKRGLGEDLVISPYSTIMSLMVAPKDACENLEILKSSGFEGKYGFYEAVDYTSSRLQRRQAFSIVKSFMAHHQGMSFLSINYLLNDKPMQQRFEADVQVKSTLLLLQERIPRITTFYSPTVHEGDINIIPGGTETMRVINTPHTTIPEVQLLSNGRYHVMLSNAGGGYSRWKNIALTRWREDCTCDNWGTFCFIRDLETNSSWSTAFQPTLKQGDNYEAVFSQGRAEFRRKDLSFETHTEIIVSPEDDIELRRVHLTNKSRKRRSIEITSYAEVVLANPMSDEAHPAFSNLFVQTEIVEHRHAIICTRRPRSIEENNPSMFHLMKVHNAVIQKISYESDRAEFIGRGNSINDPKIINQKAELSGGQGSVLDPVVAIQYRIFIEPYETAVIDMLYGIAETKELCNSLVDKYQDKHSSNRGLELSWTHSQVILRQINAVEADAQLYNRLASSIIFANASLRSDPAVIIKNLRGQPGLWSYAISGDLPIVLLQIEDVANIDLVKQLLQAHVYWRLKGLIVDLVIWNEDHGGYRQALLDRIHSMVVPGISAEIKDQPGGIFIRSADQISNEDRILFQSVAHVVISDRLGTLEEQINRGNKFKTAIPAFSPTKFHMSADIESKTILMPEGLQFFNGTGGFSKDGKEYVIITTPERHTPAPWVNVLGNPGFGTVISESGQSYTWVENAHEIRLTPWNNDPISDLKGEAFYLRDEENGRFWSPSPLPCRGKPAYITRHGFGYSSFEHREDGVDSTMTVFIDVDAPVKFIVLKIRNSSGRPRRMSVTGYVEWVLGDLRAKTIMHTITELDKRSGAILARNAYSTEFENRVAFFDVDDAGRTYTADRSEFIGRNGSLANPDAMSRTRLSGKMGAALDPCGALQVIFDLAEDEEKEITFRLGAGRNISETLSIIQKYEGNNAAKDALKKVHAFWQTTLGAVQIETPDAATNILANGWLNYQTLACRIWARSGFYQSGGAWGFRDQLQDTLSLLHSKPGLVRQQIVLCASRQFKEGDVQHWWHPPKGRGVRTTCSDDYLWLPYVTAKYVEATGDESILDESISFLEGRSLNAGEESYYDLPMQSDKQASLYDHCVNAITHGLKFGEHGLPFIGSGDWNDGMDKVGNHGKGESVWLAFFLYDILKRFSEVALLKKDNGFADNCLHTAETLRDNINKNAWDGSWYRRAYFDDGTPLGSKINEECKIDSIAQSWAVLSKAGDKDRSLMAMQNAGKQLIREQDGLIQLFDPPFDKSSLNPGYIKGYVPGVRENGGQYTHAAVWLVMAYAALGNREKTWELLKMINPLNHGSDESKINIYKVEPYVIAADVYAEPMHKGRGGWTWYTGSAGWMYQLIIESFIGLKRVGNVLTFKPCLPQGWDDVKISYRYLDTIYHIQLKDAGINNSAKIIENGIEKNESSIALVNDQKEHEVVFYGGV